jgi:hypothetical protein
VNKYSYPGEVDEKILRVQSERRRAALVAAGCATYTVGYRGGLPSIICLCCGLGSSNPNDVQNRYCGFCHEWHSEWVPEAE